jgi:signal transduction histidine kinase
MADSRSSDDSAERLALLIHHGPVQVLSAVALRLELLGRRLAGADAGEVLQAAEDVRSAVVEIGRHTNAEADPAR